MAGQSIGPMQLLVTIVERGQGRRLMEHYKKFKVMDHFQAAGRGTAASHLLDTLGFGTSERDVILSRAPRDTARQIMYQLKDDERSKLGVPGIAFTIDINGMAARLAVALSYLEQMDPERGEMMMEAGNSHNLILVSVNQGYTDEVMDTARQAGARGGTIVRARWAGAEAMEPLLNISIQTEKEIIAIVANHKERESVMSAIQKAHGLETEAQAIVISLPIDHTSRLD